MSDEHAGIEAMLGRYRPVRPPPGLRNRVLSSGDPGRSKPALAGWAALAAALMLSVGLHLAAERVTRQTVAIVGIDPVEWTVEAEEAARMLNGDGWGRRYIALSLAAGALRPESLQPGMMVELMNPPGAVQ